MEILISIFIGYIIGSIPTAYLLLKKTRGIDITQNGSGNVGAHNSWEVSRSKLIGLIVLIIDLLKGAAPVLIVSIIFGENFLNEILSLIAAVLAHCYSPWIKFKGGRGLATAAGGALIISWAILIVWIIIWLIAFAFRRNIHFANFAATLLSGGISFTSSDVLIKYISSTPDSELQLSIFVSVLLIIILSKHIQPIKEYMISQRDKKLKDHKNE